MRAGGVVIRPLSSLDETVAGLVDEATQEGFAFMRRLTSEWNEGSNRFDQAGEVYVGAFRCGVLVGVGGLNRDTHATGAVGRLRHVYIAKAARRSGVGTALVTNILQRAEGVFTHVRLRTDTRAAAAFYMRLGFQRSGEAEATHVLRLPALVGAVRSRSRSRDS